MFQYELSKIYTFGELDVNGDFQSGYRFKLKLIGNDKIRTEIKKSILSLVNSCNCIIFNSIISFDTFIIACDNEEDLRFCGYMIMKNLEYRLMLERIYENSLGDYNNVRK